MEENKRSGKEIKIKKPKIEMVPATIREVVIDKDGKTREIEKVVHLPNLEKKTEKSKDI